MTRQGLLSTTLLILLVTVIAAGVYLYQALSADLRQADSAQRAAQLQIKRLESELSRASQRLAQRTSSADSLEARLSEQMAQSDARITALLNERETLKTSLAAIREEHAGARARADKLAGEVQTLREELQQARRQIAQQMTKIAELQASLATAREEQAKTRLQASELGQKLQKTRTALGQARDQLAQHENKLETVAEERQTVAEQYRQAREQLALQLARSQNASETISELETRLQSESAAMNTLQERLQALTSEKQTLVSRLEDGTTVIKLPEKIVFDSGSAYIGKPGRETLQMLATALKSFPEHLISVQGHSDSRPISATLQSLYPTNWELSAARAASAVRVLKSNGIAPERMQAVGYADTRPLVAETSAASRRTNRRIEVLLYPDQFRVKAHSGLTGN